MSVHDAELFCECFNITKNKHNVFFVNGKVMHFDWLKATLQTYGEIKDSEFKEFVSRLDLYAKPTKQNSPYFRKSQIKYGLFGRR